MMFTEAKVFQLFFVFVNHSKSGEQFGKSDRHISTVWREDNEEDWSLKKKKKNSCWPDLESGNKRKME